MHDLLHTSTSCHFKKCLKSQTTGTTASESESESARYSIHDTPQEEYYMECVWKWPKEKKDEQ